MSCAKSLPDCRDHQNSIECGNRLRFTLACNCRVHNACISNIYIQDAYLDIFASHLDILPSQSSEICCQATSLLLSNTTPYSSPAYRRSDTVMSTDLTDSSIRRMQRRPARHQRGPAFQRLAPRRLNLKTTGIHEGLEQPGELASATLMC